MSIEAIHDVSMTLVSLLNRQISQGSPVTVDADIVIASPTDVPENLSKTAVALYLYSIIENPELKNEERLRVNHTQSRRAPLSLDLYYMLTVYPAMTTGVEAQHDHNLDAHRTLSRAMRVLYDNGILDGSVLRGSLGTRK